MASLLQSFAISEVKPPRVGENKPSAVVADVVIDTAGAGAMGLSDARDEHVESICVDHCTCCVDHCTCCVNHCTCNISGMRPDVRVEWDELRQHDVLFLLTLRPPDAYALQLAESSGRTVTPAEQHGLVYVRGCEIIEVKDAGAHDCQCLISCNMHDDTYA